MDGWIDRSIDRSIEMYTSTYIYMHTRTQTQTRHRHTRTRAHTHTHMYTHTPHAHRHMHTDAHAHTRTSISINRRTCPPIPSVKSSKLHVAAQRTASPAATTGAAQPWPAGWHHFERFTEAKRREVLPRVRVVRMDLVRSLRCAAYRATSSQGNTQGRRALAHIAACAVKYSVLSALKAFRVTTVVLGILGSQSTREQCFMRR